MEPRDQIQLDRTALNYVNQMQMVRSGKDNTMTNFRKKKEGMKEKEEEKKIKVSFTIKHTDKKIVYKQQKTYLGQPT